MKSWYLPISRGACSSGSGKNVARCVGLSNCHRPTSPADTSAFADRVKEHPPHLCSEVRTLGKSNPGNTFAVCARAFLQRVTQAGRVRRPKNGRDRIARRNGHQHAGISSGWIPGEARARRR
ncbi:unnamed protein product [Scytosiphon promiscuus]